MHAASAWQIEAEFYALSECYCVIFTKMHWLVSQMTFTWIKQLLPYEAGLGKENINIPLLLIMDGLILPV